MRRGTIYKRCRCGRKFNDKVCARCGSEVFTWAFTVDVGGTGGGRSQRSRSGFATKKAAVAALAELQGDLARGTYIAPSKITVAEFLRQEWLPSIETSVRPSTLLSYRTHVERHIVPALGRSRLQEITGSRLNQLYGRLLSSSTLSHTTVRHVHATLHRAFRDAVRWGRITRNPADQADPPKRTATAPMKTWKPEELRAFLLHVADDRLYAAWVLLATTGMRRGEALGLGWDDLDLEEGWVSIQRSLISVGYKIELSEPKTKRGRRRVALDATTMKALRDHRRGQLEERMAWGAPWTDTGGVFVKEDGTPIHPDAFSKLFNTRVKTAGLPRIRLHDLRHTHATLALQAGIHPKVVSERLGHATIAITLDTYSHAIPAMEKDAAEQVAALVFGA